MEEFQRQIIKRLDLLIRLQLDRGLPETPPSVTSIVHRLLDLGFTSAEVASIIGKPLNYVTALSSSRKAKAKASDGGGRKK